MTEEEAKTKWCPEIRVQMHHSHDGINAVLAGEFNNSPIVHRGKCIASECMMWRDTTIREKDLTILQQLKVDSGLETDILESSGYCGLAGKP